MRVLSLLAAILLCLVWVSPASANSVDINFNNEYVRAGFATELAQIGYGTSQFDTGLLYQEDRKNLGIHAGLRSTGEIATNIQGGLGARLYYINLDSGSDEVGALGLGGHARWFIQEPQQGFALMGELHGSPSIFNIIDGEGSYDVNARVEYFIWPAGAVYLGYHDIRSKVNGDWEKVDTGFHVGINFRL